jgi:hypothetical protein
MLKKTIFIKTFILYYLLLLVSYFVFKYCINEGFIVKSLFGATSVLNTYFYLYFALISFGFAIASTFVFKYYISKKIQLRIFVFFPLVCILTSVIGGFFCGVLFGVHDMLVGFYPGSSRFISNMFDRGIETSLVGVFIAFNSFAIFTILLIISAFGLLEFLRHKYLLNNLNKKQ